MPRLNELEQGESICMLYYGPAGAGKTHFVGTAGSRTLIINTGMGLVTLQSKGFKTRYPGVNPIIETIYEEPLPEKATGHDQVCDILDKYLDPKNPLFSEFDTVAVDDATALKRMAMNLALEINRDLNKSESLVKSKKHDQIVKAVQDYGQEMDIIDKFIIDYITACKKYNKHFILTAHERVSYGKPPGVGQPAPVIKIRPGFTGQTFPDNVTGYFDLVWYAETQGAGERINYRARTAGDSALVAKTRWDGIFPVLVPNPNFLEVVKKIRES